MSRSAFVRDIRDAVEGLDAIAQAVSRIASAPKLEIFAPTAPQGPAGIGGAGGDRPQGDAPVDLPGPNLKNRTAAATLGGAPAPQGGVGAPIFSGAGVPLGSGGSGAPGASGEAGRGSRTKPAQAGRWAHLVDGRLFPAYPPGNPAEVGAKVGPASYTPPVLAGQPPVTYQLDGYDCSFVLNWPEATRLVYWRVPDRSEIGSRLSSGNTGGTSAGGGGGARQRGGSNGYNVPATSGGTYQNDGRVYNTGGASSATMSTGESAIVGALGSVTAELRAIRKENANGGMQLRAGGAV